MENNRGISQNYGCKLARPYINDQVLTKMYNLSTGLKKGTIFPELFLIDSEMYNKELYSTPKIRRGGRK
ncbi:spore coat associated protein CotJA [Asaccharospora irregularis]|uniref:Spore coat associated protein JA (CotJA) n=1 Tax=Asaccharospora irregularis DSM 2635 TaxID=1121321 RepID=A0A1M5MT43_9FIRM|nr:spore coat associated protein CotJA [Asaccharospora irregularis]SHG80488.1 Spore coat associated protein JA (CotJA) [Asaccharospora irregularis DSM 2635]